MVRRKKTEQLVKQEEPEKNKTEITKKRTRSQVSRKVEVTQEKIVKTIKLNNGQAKKVEVAKKRAQAGKVVQNKPKPK